MSTNRAAASTCWRATLLGTGIIKDRDHHMTGRMMCEAQGSATASSNYRPHGCYLAQAAAQQGCIYERWTAKAQAENS